MRKSGELPLSRGGRDGRFRCACTDDVDDVLKSRLGKDLGMSRTVLVGGGDAIELAVGLALPDLGPGDQWH
jgi:hypothetical protein